MSRFINADVFEVFSYTSQDGTFDDGVQFVLEKIDEQPTADVVEVVRCKDCIHNHEHETSFGSKFHICDLNKLAFTQYADFYCAYGERGK